MKGMNPHLMNEGSMFYPIARGIFVSTTISCMTLSDAVYGTLPDFKGARDL